LKQLLEAGVHFGHQKNRWNPKMKEFIFGEKNGIYIINLQKTVDGISKALEFLRRTVSSGGYILFVGTKKQAKDMVKEQALKCQMFYVVERWLGGTLTNFTTIRQSVKRLDYLDKLKEDGTFDLLSKKERSQLTKEYDKLIKNLQGVRKMVKLPAAMFVVDSKNEETAVKEAVKLSIPVVALVDTNADPDKVDYVIPGNDDAIKSIELISQLVADSVLEARQGFLKGEAEAAEQKKAEKGKIAIKADDEEVEKLVGEEIKDQPKEQRIKKKPQRRKTK